MLVAQEKQEEMMFKNTSEKMDYMKRVASFSMREHANGRIDHLPEWAQEPEAYYNSVRDQYESLAKQLHETKETVHRLKVRLRQTLPHAEYERLNAELNIQGPRQLELERETADYRQLARSAAVNAFGAVYYYCAQRLLDKDTRIKIENEVAGILNRSATDGIGKTNADLSADRRHRITVHKHKKNRLKAMRDKHGISADRVVVWSDEKGGRQSAPMMPKSK